MKKIILATLIILLSVSTSFALVVTPMDNATGLVNNILGTGVSVSNISYTGVNSASGYFSGGITQSNMGIESGIMLTSGTASLANGITNDSDSETGSNGLAGDSDLNALIPQSTQDATVLEFDLTTGSGDLFFNYVFASEEYNEFTNSGYNDVFAFFLDGVNIALIPGTTTPVSINSINGGNPYGTNASNIGLYNNNDPNDGGAGAYPFEYDGFTDVFTATALGIGAGTHHLKLAIADAGDTILDSAVFIQAGTVQDTPPPAVPEPGTFLLLGFGIAGFIGFRKKYAN